MARLSLAAVLALTIAPSAYAIEKTVALEGLKQIAELKSMDMDDVICDECLEEIDCIWPCELACVMNVPAAFAGKVCTKCLEYFGCEGCQFMCPNPITDAPTMNPTSEPTVAPSFNPTDEPTSQPSAVPAKVPTAAPSMEPTDTPTARPTNYPTDEPTSHPSYDPTVHPTMEPTNAPTDTPTYEPTAQPSTNPTIPPTDKPTEDPTSEPTASPSLPPTSAPTIPPTGAPTVTPEFFVYYTVADKKMYAYNTIMKTTELYATGNFTGDVKVDSPNKFMFWSDPQARSVFKLDMTNMKVSTLLNNKPVMGISVDPSRGELYLANQGAGEENKFSGAGIDIIDYAGSNVSTVHSMESLELEPYSVEVDPSFVLADFNDNDPGILLVTCHDGTSGYIYQANLFGGLFEKVYKTSTIDIFGIILDAEHSMMWWIENRGVANGVYNTMLENPFQSTYVTYLEESYWLAAVWDYDLMYTTDYEQGVVYEATISSSAGEFSAIATLAYVEKPRCLAFYYGGNAANDDDALSAISSNAASSPHPLDAPQGAPGTAEVSLPETDGTSSTPAALLPGDVEDLAESSGASTEGTVPTSTYLSVGALVAGVVGVAVYKRRGATYSEIQGEEEFSI